MTTSTTQGEPSMSPVSDHPAALGDLSAIFARRRIAAGIDSNGHVVLARPDSLVIEVGEGAELESIRRRVLSSDRAKQIVNVDETSSAGVITVRLQVTNPTTINRETRWSLSTANDVRDSLARAGVDAELNHVFLGAQTVTGNPLGAPATWAGEMAFTGKTVTTNGVTTMLTTAEPTVPPAFLREPLRIDKFGQPKVLVLDTGLRTENGAGTKVEHTALDCCAIHAGWVNKGPGVTDDEDEPDDDATGTLDFEAGHGTFISGVIRQLCPDAHIDTAGVLSSFGDGDVSGVLAAFERMVTDFGPYDIVVMSFGSFFADDDPGAFGTALMTLLGDALGVAAAGNQATCRPYFPAGLTDVISVGGLAADGKAWFSNFGGWVDACAPAVDVVSTFFEDFTEMIDRKEHRHYDGWARWSGTSFSAPKVAAVIAQEMYLNQVTAKEAWKRVTSHKHLRYPDLGIVFNV